MSTLATQKATAKSVIDAYNAWDLELIMAFRAPSCQTQVLPKSLGRPLQNNDEYRKRLGAIMPWFSKFTVRPSPISLSSPLLSSPLLFSSFNC
jgi:hypothetical protein